MQDELRILQSHLQNLKRLKENRKAAFVRLSYHESTQEVRIIPKNVCN